MKSVARQEGMEGEGEVGWECGVFAYGGVKNKLIK